MSKPALAAVTQPEQWPEVISVAQVFARSAGVGEQRMGRYQRDPGFGRWSSFTRRASRSLSLSASFRSFRGSRGGRRRASGSDCHR
ncbi:MAG TPA: hypothetical protein VHW01_25745 [Polyangiaceae bacterium]|nr:hypothetical protein [Polyangiaceae bacterium]